MITDQDVANEETAEYAAVLNEAIGSATRAESERDAAKAALAALKRKYEPDTGVLLSKMLRLADDDSTIFLRVTVRTGGYMLLELVPRARHLPHFSSWKFFPLIEGKRDNMQDFGDYGTYEVSIGDVHSSHELLVTFSEPATVDITVATDHDGNYGVGPDEMSIEEFTTPTAVSLTIDGDTGGQ
jgi:hypothetical protein